MTAALLAAGCSGKLGDSTTGEQGAVEFEYSGWSCLFGCGMKQPLLSGTEQTISVKGGRADDSGVVARSTNPRVATFTLRRSCGCEQSDGTGTTYMSANDKGGCRPDFRLVCDNEIDVQALAPGEAGLELRASSGELIDKTTVHVATASSMTLHGEDGMEIGVSLKMKRGDDVSVTARLVDAQGRELLADKGVTWTIDGGAVSSGWCLLCRSNAEQLQAVAPGDSTIAVHAASVDTSFAVHVDL